MSRHYYSCQSPSGPVRVVLGYDRILDEFYLQVEAREGAPDAPSHLYASHADLQHDPTDLDYYRSVLEALGIAVPDSLFRAVEFDAAHRIGNLIVEHFPSGASRRLDG